MATAATAVAARLPFSKLPLTTDEGGYGEVARLWARGATLYEDIWVDRPQGLILVFRALLHVDGGSATAMRVAAALAGALLALVAMLVALRLAGAGAAAAAGLLAAAAGSSPFIESFTLSGELLAAIPAAVSVLVFTFYVERKGFRWLVLAGLAAGCAFLVKQSAIDPVLAVSALLLWTERKRALKSLAVFGSAALVPVVLAAAAAHSLGAWWYAVVAYRGDGDSLLTGGVSYRLSLFAWSLPVLVKGLGLLIAAAALGWSRTPKLVRLWTLAAVVGILGGGNFHEHYFIQLVPPLSVAGGIFVSRLFEQGKAGRKLSLAGLAGAAVLSLWATAPIYAADRHEQVLALFRSDRLLVQEWGAGHVAAHAVPGDEVLVLPEAPNLHYLTGRAPVTPYLWASNVRGVPGALEMTTTSVAEMRPAVIVLTRPPAIIDPTGRLATLIRRNYRVTAQRGPARVLVRR